MSKPAEAIPITRARSAVARRFVNKLSQNPSVSLVLDGKGQIWFYTVGLNQELARIMTELLLELLSREEKDARPEEEAL